MRVRTSNLINGFLACVLFLSFASVIHAADDTRFTFKDGVIDDAKSGLQWVPAPLKAMNHYDAEEYALNLSVAGGGWRLPTIEELKGIYDNSQPGGAYPIFNVTNKWVWSSKVDECKPSVGWYFDFEDGLEIALFRDKSYNNGRVLAVRSRR